MAGLGLDDDDDLEETLKVEPKSVAESALVAKIQASHGAAFEDLHNRLLSLHHANVPELREIVEYAGTIRRSLDAPQHLLTPLLLRRAGCPVDMLQEVVSVLTAAEGCEESAHYGLDSLSRNGPDVSVSALERLLQAWSHLDETLLQVAATAMGHLNLEYQELQGPGQQAAGRLAMAGIQAGRRSVLKDLFEQGSYQRGLRLMGLNETKVANILAGDFAKTASPDDGAPTMADILQQAGKQGGPSSDAAAPTPPMPPPRNPIQQSQSQSQQTPIQQCQSPQTPTAAVAARMAADALSGLSWHHGAEVGVIDAGGVFPDLPQKRGGAGAGAGGGGGGGVRVSFVGPELPGDFRYQAAGVCSNGRIYGVPYSLAVRRVLEFDPADRSAGPFGDELAEHEEARYTAAVVGTDGKLYAVPCAARKCLVLNPRCSSLGEEAEVFGQEFAYGGLKYQAAVLAQNGCIYGIPFNARRFLEIVPDLGTAFEVGRDLPQGGFKYVAGAAAAVLESSPSPPRQCPASPLPSSSSSSSSLSSPHPLPPPPPPPPSSQLHRIYAVPFEARRVLEFDIATGRHHEIGDDLGDGGQRYACAVTANNGRIYAAPCNSRRVLEILPAERRVREIGPDLGPLPFKYQQVILSPQGSVFAIPYDAEDVLEIVPEEGIVRKFGRPLTGKGEKYVAAAVAGNGKIYAVPCSANHVLQIDPSKAFDDDDDKVGAVSFVGESLGDAANKFMVALTSPASGNVYGVPFCADKMLEISMKNLVVKPDTENQEDTKLFYRSSVDTYSLDSMD